MKIQWLDGSGFQQSGTVPAAILEIIELIGEDATVNLLTALGGSVVAFPRCRPSSDGVIAQAIGIEATLTLGKQFMGDRLRVPTGSKFLARHLRGKGLTVNEIARAIRRSDVSVRSYLKSDAPKDQAKSAASASRFAKAATRRGAGR